MALFIAIIWGLLSGQIFVQALLSLAVAAIYLIAVIGSQVEKRYNLAGATVSLFQALIFVVLFVAGNWFASDYIDFVGWNMDSIVALVAFLFAVAYVVPQIPGKILLARMCAWRPSFFEASHAVPQRERVAFARQVINDGV